MSHCQARPISPWSIAAACLAGALAAGIVVAATQSLPSPRLTGEAAPAASVLSLWYRTPASDYPLLTADAPRESREAASVEWVRALLIGNGRLGAMVFGGVVHERLPLNEDTLWAGRPYDPVNPEARDALAAVRHLLAERKYADAAKLVEAKVMSKPLAQMPSRDGWRSRADTRHTSDYRWRGWALSVTGVCRRLPRP